jgi:hypothetical protein
MDRETITRFCERSPCRAKWLYLFAERIGWAAESATRPLRSASSYPRAHAANHDGPAGLQGLHSPIMETFRLLFFTTIWTAIWAAPLPKLSRGVELVAGLIPFAAFGLRVFGACFIGVPADDPVRMTVAPLVDWINGVSGTVPFQWVLDVTVAIGLVWFASIANIPRPWRLATIWIMPAVALASLALGRS